MGLVLPHAPTDFLFRRAFPVEFLQIDIESVLADFMPIKDTPLNNEITAKEKTYTVDAGKKVKVAVKVLQ